MSLSNTSILRSHARGRRIVECAIGLYKNVWRCTSDEKKLRVKSPIFACEIIKACGYLHNFRIGERRADENNDEEFFNDSEQDEAADDSEQDDAADDLDTSDEDNDNNEDDEAFSRLQFQFDHFCEINGI